MAGVATKKPGGDFAVQLTFPAVFQAVYADSGEGERYAPSFLGAPAKLREAEGLQGAYHAQKRQDAHRMVMAAVAARQAAEKRLLASHANYYGMPKAVLGQRIYANPSLGNFSSAIDSARRTMPGSQAPFRCMSAEERSGAAGGCGSCYESQLSGGVLFTKSGQEWAAKKLQARVQQLDAIDAAAMSDSLDSGVGVSYPAPSDLQELSLKTQLDMSALFGDLLNSLMAGNVRAIAQYTLGDLGKLIRLIARWSITAKVEDFREAIDNLQAIYEAVLAQAANEQDIVVEAAEAGAPGEIPEWDLRRVMELIAPRVAALLQYTEAMYAKAHLTPRDRQAASKALLKSTGLTKLAIEPLRGDLRGLLGEVILGRRGAAADPEEARDEVLEMADARAEGRDPPNFRMGRFRDDDGDDDEFDAPARPAGAVAAAAVAVRAPRFDADRRQQMGARHGAFVGEALPELEVEEMAVRNPMRRMAPAGLQPRRAPLDPIFEDMPAAAARAAPAAVARPAARAPRARARAAPVINPAMDLRRWFVAPEGEAAAAAPQGRGRGKRAPAKKRGKGKTEAEKAARRATTRLAAISQLIDRHIRFGEELPEFARKALDDHRVAKAAAAVRRDGRTMTAEDIMGLIGRVSMEEVGRLAKEHLEHADASAAATVAPAAAKAPKKESTGMVSPSAALLVARAKEGKKSGEGKSLMGLTRATLPKDREGYVALASKLRGMGHNIRVNSGSQLKSIRANFIKKLGL